MRSDGGQNPNLERLGGTSLPAVAEIRQGHEGPHWPLVRGIQALPGAGVFCTPSKPVELTNGNPGFLIPQTPPLT